MGRGDGPLRISTVFLTLENSSSIKTTPNYINFANSLKKIFINLKTLSLKNFFSKNGLLFWLSKPMFTVYISFVNSLKIFFVLIWKHRTWKFFQFCFKNIFGPLILALPRKCLTITDHDRVISMPFASTLKLIFSFSIRPVATRFRSISNTSPIMIYSLYWLDFLLVLGIRVVGFRFEYPTPKRKSVFLWVGFWISAEIRFWSRFHI